MNGLKGFDPENEPNDLVVFIAMLGWIFFLVGVIDVVLEWLTTCTWFV